MPLDLQTALAQYGLVGLYARNNPEINAVLNKAIAGEWDSARFERELWNTNWWKQLSEQKRLLDVQRVTDPATYSANLANKAKQVGMIAQQLGRTANVNRVAELALQNGWSDDYLQAYINDTGALIRAPGGGYAGRSGEVESHIREMWANYGIPSGHMNLEARIQDVLSNRMTLGGLDSEIRNYAKRLFPQFTAEIDAGYTLRDIAEPFIQTMANTLEISPTDITLNDQSIKKALSWQEPKSNYVTTMPLWEFERFLKNDVRWDKTKQARNETYAILEQVGKDWGFA